MSTGSIHTEEDDSTLHNPQVAQELTKLMLLPRDMEELKSHFLSEVVLDVYLAW